MFDGGTLTQENVENSLSTPDETPKESRAPKRVLRCIVGHMWEQPIRQGVRAAKVCPEHRPYFRGSPHKSVMPPRHTMQEWEDAEENLVNEVGYARRWRLKWKEKIRILAAKQGSWSDLDLEGLDEYIRHLRFAELHRLYAQDDPYYTTKSGQIREHPGWKRSDAEMRRARECAVLLGLTHDITPAPKRGPDRQPRRTPTMPSALEQEAEQLDDGIIDNQVGPDGEPL